MNIAKIFKHIENNVEQIEVCPCLHASTLFCECTKKAENGCKIIARDYFTRICTFGLVLHDYDFFIQINVPLPSRTQLDQLSSPLALR